MDRKKSLLFVSGIVPVRRALSDALKGRYDCHHIMLDKFPEGVRPFVAELDGIVIDMNLGSQADIDLVRQGLVHAERSRTFLAFVVNPYRQSDLTSALQLGTDKIIPLMEIIQTTSVFALPERAVSNAAMTDFVETGVKTIDWLALRFAQPPALKVALEAGEAALRAVFDLHRTGICPSKQDFSKASASVAAGLQACGLQTWLDMIKSHHSATYRHSLIVTGIVSSFSETLGLGAHDREQLTVSGMLHDIGKAKIPLQILEKHQPLTPEETLTLREHPVLGRSIVCAVDGFDPQIMDVIVHHHEYLDGSGYPHKLRGNEIADMTRLVTITDIFGDLIERRPYKPELTSSQAYDVLSSMNKQLDMPLVKAFGKVVASLAS